MRPGYADLQVNGYVGVDFNDPDCRVDQIQMAAKAMLDDGVEFVLPTVITASPQAMVACIENLVDATRDDEVTANLFRGIHVEGPFLSPVPGFIGAHPAEFAAGQDLKLLDQLIDAGQGHIGLLTLAPEIDPRGALTAHCMERGIRVAAGHTDASLVELETCIAAGLSLFTHLGNGCPRMMDRHDNIIYRALRFARQIHFSLIADGFHIPKVLFLNLLEWIPRERIIVVSDAISAAGLGPGVYQLGGRQVKIGEDRAARDPSGEHFVGSASRMGDADRWLEESLGLNARERRQLLVENPRQFLGL